MRFKFNHRWYLATSALLVLCLGAVAEPTNDSDIKSKASRLAVSILFSSPAHSACSENLKASVLLYSVHLMPHTPTDLFVFTLSQHLDYMKSCLADMMKLHPNIMVVSIPAPEWAVPEHVVNESQWHTHFAKGYRWGVRGHSADA